MKTEYINNVISDLKDSFSAGQIKKITKALQKSLENKEIIETIETQPKTNEAALAAFLSAKKIEGCSLRSLTFYQVTLQKMFFLLISFIFS